MSAMAGSQLVEKPVGSAKGVAARRARSWLRLWFARLACFIAVPVLIAAFVPGVADANYELVSSFGEASQGLFGEGTFAGSPSGLALNDVSGDVYIPDTGNRVQRFDAEGHFLEEWGWGVGDGLQEFERCGPDGELAHGLCSGRDGHGLAWPGEGEAQLIHPDAVAVDQTTGDVYVVSSARSHGVVQIYTKDGEYRGAFGTRGEETASQIQAPGVRYSLAIAPTGTVYLLDSGEAFGPRVMVFEMSVPGDVTSYSYSGDLFGPRAGGYATGAVAVSVDDAGDIFLDSRERELYRFAAGIFTAPACEVAKPAETIAVDPATGALFYFTGVGKQFSELASECSGESWRVVSGPFDAEKEETDALGIGYNPNAVVAGHRAGALYAATSFAQRSSRPARVLTFAQQEEHRPTVAGLEAHAVGVTNATLSGRVNPEGFPTRYWFRYGDSATCSGDSCAEVPVGGAQIAPGHLEEKVDITVGGLSPATRYRYTLIATNEFGGAEGVEEGTFSTFAANSGGPPDQRVLEMVSPVDKHGGEVFPLDSTIGSCGGCAPGENNNSMPMESAADGNAVVFEGFPFATSGGAVSENEYVAKRTETAWQVVDVAPPTLEREGGGFRAFSHGFGSAVVAQREPPLGAGAPLGFVDLYLRAADGNYIPLVTTAPPNREPRGESNRFNMAFAGASADFSHLLFEANDALTGATAVAPAAADDGVGKNNLYEWVGGETRLVNVAPGNASSVPGASFGSGRELVSTQESGPDISHAISQDGSRVFWSDAAGKVYVRQNGDSTFEIPGGGMFVTASADGSRVLLSNGHLYDLENGNMSDVTGGRGGFIGILGASADLSTVYIIDSMVLTGSEANSYGRTAEAGGDNLYFYTGGHVRFVATLSGRDEGFGVDSLVGDWEISPANRTAQVTPDGLYVAFMSLAPLTGFDNRAADGAHCEQGARCFELFEFSAAAGKLVCVSCNATDVRPVGDSWLSLVAPTSSRFAQPHNLTDSGRLFFDSFDALAAEDVMPGVENVYEYEYDGQGTCSDPSGCIGLLSSGHSRFDAALLDASASSGSDVFITTRERLVSEDTDEAFDLYDARERGGFRRVAPVAPCSGEGCKQLTSGAPILSVGGSAIFSEPSDVPASAVRAKPNARRAKCRRGRVLRRGQCMKRRRKTTARKIRRRSRAG